MCFVILFQVKRKNGLSTPVHKKLHRDKAMVLSQKKKNHQTTHGECSY